MKFRASFDETCWYIEENLPNGAGWNKVGKIAGLTDELIPSEDWYKLHVGWRMVTINDEQILGISLFCHTFDKYIAHWLDSIPFNTNAGTSIWVDMYLGRFVLGLVVGDKSIGIHDHLTGEFWGLRSRFRKTFYFGGKSAAPHTMYLDFDNMHFDKPGYQDYFNSRNYMIWNLTEFWNGNNFVFYANKQIEGSIANPGAVTSAHPNLNKQECIIKYGASITFIAGESIKLHPGFKVEPGGHFVAKIGSKELYNEVKDSLEKQLSYNDSCLVSNSTKVKNDQSHYTYSTDTNIKYKNLLDSENNIADLKNENFNIYPNPHPGIFNIEIYDEEFSVFSLQVINMMGNTVYQKKSIPAGKTKINIKSQPKGIYFLKVQIGEKVYTEKVVYL